MSRTVRVLLAIVGIGVFATGCESRGPQTDIRFVIGVAQANLAEPWREVMNDEIQTAIDQHPGVRVVFTNADGSTLTQEDNIRHLTRLGIDLLIVSPVEARAMAPIIRDVYRRMPVIVLDKAVEGYDYSLFIGVDNRLVGRQAARFVKEHMGNEPGTVIEVTGPTDSLPVVERARGFRGALADTPSIQLVERFNAGWFRDRAEEITEAHLDLFSSATVVFAHNDAMAYGVYRALSSAGVLKPRIIGIDGLTGEQGGLSLVREGRLEATITCPTGGREAVNRAMDILEGRDGLPKKIFLRSSLVTESILSSDHAAIPTPKPRVPDDPIVVGFAQTGNESAWRAANTRSITSAAAEGGITLIFRDAALNQARQIAALREFIAADVDVIAFSPLVATGWDEVLIEAKNAGIPVIASDRTVEVADETLITTFIVADFMEEGRRAAQWVLEATADRDDVRIVEISGLKGSTPATDRHTGFAEVITRSAAHQIVGSASGDFINAKGYDAMCRLLSSQERIDVVYAHNDDMALGAIKALKEYGLAPGRDILIVSIDGVREAFEAMIAGDLNCSVECSPLLGPQLMKAVTDYVAGQELPLRINTDEGIFPAEVAAEYIYTRLY